MNVASSTVSGPAAATREADTQRVAAGYREAGLTARTIGLAAAAMDSPVLAEVAGIMARQGHLEAGQ